MEKTHIVDTYFNQLTKHSKCTVKSQITGLKYSLCNQGEKGELIRCFLDDQVEASISNIASNEKYSFTYVDSSDLIIIGFCLEGGKILDYKGENKIEKGDIIYFRPTEDFSISLSDHSFLYYYIDCNSFKENLQSRNCHDLFCDFHIDYICQKGEIHIEKSPDIIMAHLDEIKQIKKMRINNFLDYAQMKGKLLNYLTWFIRLRLSENPNFDEGRCQRHYVAKAKKIIIDHLEEQITVKEIAQRLDISVYILQKSFKDLEDTTVYDFIRKTKIETSKIYLNNSHCPIIEVAQKVGYENPSKFSTTFKSITGYTPTEYRNL